MNHFSFTTQPEKSKFAKFGLLVLQSDETIEHDMQRMLPADKTTQYVSRVENSSKITSESLADMASTIPAAAKLLPPGLQFDVVGYGCTSASSVIGADKVRALVRGNCQCNHVTEPLSAAIAACKHLGVNKLAFLSPYIEEVSANLRATMENAGINTTVFGSFNEGNDDVVAQIDQRSIIDAAIKLGGNNQSEAVFISCTGLKTLDCIPQIEQAISKPVFSSNIAMAWHMCALGGVANKQTGFGKLMVC